MVSMRATSDIHRSYIWYPWQLQLVSITGCEARLRSVVVQCPQTTIDSISFAWPMSSSCPGRVSETWAHGWSKQRRRRRVSEVPSETARVQASKRKPYKDVRRRTLISARSAPRALVCHDARMPSSSQRYGVRRIDGYGRWHA